MVRFLDSLGWYPMCWTEKADTVLSMHWYLKNSRTTQYLINLDSLVASRGNSDVSIVDDSIKILSTFLTPDKVISAKNRALRPRIGLYLGY